MMVAGGIRDSTQQPQASAEDEALKRNTDCVYFLASPLTCKKGSDCEYRHSEYARVNPRDCWYWLNGNCMNPKCAFRHPPLDGLLGTQAATSVGSSLPTTQTPAAASAVTATNAPYNSGKQAVPCIFFQKGLCLKGDRCAFSHGPIPISNKAPQVPAAAPGSEPPNPNKVFGSLEKCNQEQKLLQANMSKSIEQPLTAKPGVRQENALPKSVNATGKSIPGPTKIKDEVSIHNVTGVAPITNGSSMIRSNRPNQNDVSDDQSFQNGKDADEFYRESSPGFDVLVDDELRDSDYYRDDDQFGRVHEQRDLDDFDVGRSAGYHSLADVDRQMFQDPHGYDSYERMQGQYAWDQRRASSERLLAGSDPLERRGYHKTESPDQITESDLRYRLSKQRRVNGLRSVISHDFAPDKDDKERSHRSSRRDSRHSSLHESSLSSRLRGRIKIPGRSSPPNGYDIPAEREMDRGRNLGRLSPGRTQSSSHQGRLRDRIKGRVPEDFSSEERNFRGPRMTRDIMNERSFHFTGPKSLAELKVNKTAEGKEQQVNRPEFFSLGKRKNLEDHQPSECDLSFEGPKPLSEILKRKRGAEISVSGSGPLSSNNESKESLMGSSDTLSVTEMHNVRSSASEKEANLHVLEAKEDFKYPKADRVRKADGLSPSSKSELEHGQSSQVQNVDELETEEGMIVDEGTEDQEFEAYDQRDGDFDYEQVDGGEYNIGEGENADAEEEYPDDEEDGDDFAKKIGVMFS